jgi:hypothetical protein
MVPGPHLVTPSRAFSRYDSVVSATVFHWFTPTDGNLSGAWPPPEGREEWTGEPEWWEQQLKQMMMANLDVIYVHLIERFEQQRLNLFTAYARLRLQGFALPRIVPFLDPFGIWSPASIDVASEAGKDEFVRHYIRFYRQFFETNDYPGAGSAFMRIEDRLFLATWWVAYILSNLNQFTRGDVEARLAAAFPEHPEVFGRGIWMATTALIDPDLTFSDERAVMFSGLHYCVQAVHNDIRCYHLQPGYWDQNIRSPGLFMPRVGGKLYRTGWDYVVALGNVHRVYIESWNEYDESSGIHAASAAAPARTSEQARLNDDSWSDSGDPFEYIRTTHRGASQINKLPELDAKVLHAVATEQARGGETLSFQLVVRNEGNAVWAAQSGYGLGVEQLPDSPGDASDFSVLLAEQVRQFESYGGACRGFPVVFDVSFTVPSRAARHKIRCRMYRELNGEKTWFGETSELTLAVTDGR